MTEFSRRSGTVIVLAAALLIPLETGCQGLAPKEVAISTKSEEARQLFLEGRETYENLRTDDARGLFSGAIEADEDFAMAYLYRAFTAASTKDRRQDMERAVTLVSQVSEGERLQVEAVAALYLENNLEEWAQGWYKIARLFPDDKRAHWFSGFAHAAKNEDDQAIVEFEKAVEIDRNFPPPYNNLGYAYLAKGEYEKAEESFSNYIRLIPDEPNPYDSMADLYTKLGRHEEAVSYYEKALERDTGFTASQQKIGINLVFLGKPEEGRTAIRKAMNLETTPAGKLANVGALARSHLYEGNYKQALAACDQAVKVANEANLPRRIAYYSLMMCLTHIEMGSLDEADKNLAECREMLQTASIIPYYRDFYTKSAMFDQGLVAAKQGDYEKAMDGAEQLKTKIQAGHDPTEMGVFYFPLVGYVHLENKAYDEAIKHFAQADQENPWTLYHLAVAQSRAGDKERASELLGKVANWNQDSFPYAFVRAKALAALKEE